jgi:hypothetical protein
MHASHIALEGISIHIYIYKVALQGTSKNLDIRTRDNPTKPSVMLILLCFFAPQRGCQRLEVQEMAPTEVNVYSIYCSR